MAAESKYATPVIKVEITNAQLRQLETRRPTVSIRVTVPVEKVSVADHNGIRVTQYSPETNSTINTIQAAMHTEGRNRPTPQQLDELRRILTDREIAAEFGVEPEAPRAWLKYDRNRGYSPTHPTARAVSETDEVWILEKFREGMLTVNQLALETGYTWYQLDKFLRSQRAMPSRSQIAINIAQKKRNGVEQVTFWNQKITPLEEHYHDLVEQLYAQTPSMRAVCAELSKRGIQIHAPRIAHYLTQKGLLLPRIEAIRHAALATYRHQKSTEEQKKKDLKTAISTMRNEHKVRKQDLELLAEYLQTNVPKLEKNFKEKGIVISDEE